MTACRLTIVCAFLGASAQATTAFNNTTNDLFAGLNFQINNLAEAGDQVTLIPGTLQLTQVMIDVFNSDGSDRTSSPTLRLYNVIGSTLGSLITTLTIPNATFVSGASTTLSFAFSQLAIPNELVWTLQFDDSTGLELNLFDPPTVGSSDPTTAWFRSNAGSLTLSTFDPGPGGNYERNFNVRFDVADSAPVPEPSTVFLVGTALLLLGRRR